MLIFFHYFGIFIFQLLRNRKRLKALKAAEISSGVDETDLENNLTFDPPVYRQRYLKVYETIIQEKWRNNLKKLVDFGCAEYSLFIYVKNLNIIEILFVDIDESLLEEKIGKLEPLLVDHLRRRNCPLEVSAYRGSVVDPDYRLRKTDIVTAIELIEHLYPDTLDAFPYNIFSFIRPKLVIITTPNADFNVVFQRTEGFRHPDHKFEWTREQFEDWATNIVQRFPDYTVEFCGIGESPNHSKSIGCCSQAATFTRKDVLSDKYISSLYARPCQCDKTSPCKGQTTESKLLCSCLCGFCLPDFSVGVCTYLSCNLNESEAYRAMKVDPKKSSSDTDLTCKSQLSFNTKRTEINSDINPSYNIFYKLIQKIVYPYEIDSRSETEKLMETFKYRINVFSYGSSRFYVEGKERCEIPVRDIIYGDIDISSEEARRLLCDGGYQVEKCIIPETEESEYCIISMPQEMEDIPSSSETTDEYSSKSSDPNDGTNNIEFLSDWDEIDFIPKEKQPISEQGATSSSLEPSTEPKKPKSDPLFDSGYLKSPSPLETNPKLLPISPQDNPESTETDQFEDAGTTPNLRSEDNKLHLKKTTAKEKFVGIMSNADSHKTKVDPHKVNELDRFRNTKAVMEAFMVPQDFKKGKDLCVAGTSSSCKKSRKFKDKEKKPPEKKEFKEPTILDDAKSLTNCIIQNSLNIIEVDGEIAGPGLELIQDLSPLREPQDILEIIPREQQNEPIAEPVVVPPPMQAVENGDLANNNRDNEGNNLIEDDVQDVDEGIDLLNDNLEELAQLLEDNVNLIENNNDLRIEIAQVIEEPQQVVAEPGQEANNDPNDIIELEAGDNSVAQASREVLYDANSVPDLLEDFDIPPQANHDNVFNLLDFGNSVIFLGMHPISSIGTRREQSTEAASVQTNSNSFPNWLLQILGTHVVPEEEALASFGRHDEPHFYCQGDGLGVHPSIIAVDVDETEDADNDTTSEETSSNNTTDFAEVDPGPSEMYDMSSLPEESSAANSMVDDVVRTTGHDNGRGQNENRTLTSQHSIQDRLIATQEGTNIVNYIISEAVNEITFRSTSFTNMEDNHSWSTSENLPSCSRSQASKKPHKASKDATNGSETSLEYLPDSLITQCSAAPITPDTPKDSTTRSLPKKSPVSQPTTDLDNSLLEIASFNTSDESDYFDSKSEEF